MKRYFQLMILLLVAQNLKAGDEIGFRKWVPPFNIYETTSNPDLIPQQCQIQLHFMYGDTAIAGRRIYMSINGVLEELVLQNFDPITYDLNPGKYVFKIWGGPGYEEIVTDSIELASQTVSQARVRIESASEPVMVLKPVIYFHSDQDIEVSANVNPAGEFTFTYPEINSGWKGTVTKNGSFVMNGQSFPYLFWESNQMYSFKSSNNGFKVDRKDVISFLEKKCREFGFNAKEATDFITFWGPKISSSESVFIQFTVDEFCSQFADLNITPTPDDVKRVYIQFTEWNEVMSPYLKDQTFQPISNQGFTVLEWGGFSFSLPEMAF